MTPAERNRNIPLIEKLQNMANYLSSPLIAQAGNLRLFRALWGAYSLALLAMSLVPGSSVPPITLLGWDKLAHAVAFGALGVLTWGALRKTRRPFWWLTAYGAIMGAATEWLQGFAPGRSVSLYDWIADMVGVMTVVVFVGIWTRRRARRDGAEEPVTAAEAVAPIRER